MGRYYLYCILRAESLNLEQWRGVELTVVTRDGISLVVSPYNPNMQVMSESFVTLHAELMDHLMADYPLLPVRFGTVLGSLEKGEELLAAEAPHFSVLLDKIQGKVETGLKALWKEPELGIPGKQEAVKTGKDYLSVKLKQAKRQQQLEHQARSLGEKINQRFRWVEDLQVKYLVSPRIFYNAAFLLPLERIHEFQRQVDELKQNFPELKFLASGPWPPYNFCGPAKEERRC